MLTVGGVRIMQGANNWHKDLLEKFRLKGIENFDDSEILKLLLGYTPDCKNISAEEIDLKVNKMMMHLGSAAGVMDVFPEVVTSLIGIDKKSSMLLGMIPDLARKYCRGNHKADCTRKNEVFDSVQKIGDFLAARYVGAANERLSILILDDNKRFISFNVIQEGSLSVSPVNAERILELLFGYNGSCFVLAHNHPDGIVLPSKDDIEVTKKLLTRCKFFGKEMLEHIIVCYDRYLPILEYIETNRILALNEEENGNVY